MIDKVDVPYAIPSEIFTDVSDILAMPAPVKEHIYSGKQTDY